MSKKAFTLIELLVVIVIVGLLLALMVPVFGRAREAARRAACVNNIRQVGMAWLLYLEDKNGNFPGSAYTVSYGGKQGTSFLYNCRTLAKNRILNPYVGIDVSKPWQEVERNPALDVFRCPSDLKKVPEYSSTYFNSQGTSYYADAGTLNSGNISSITTPHSAKIFVRDSSYPRATAPSPHGGYWPNTNVNILYLDGHVGATNQFRR